MTRAGVSAVLLVVVAAACTELNQTEATTDTAASDAPAATTGSEFTDLPVPGAASTSLPIRTAPEVKLTPDQVPDYYMAIQQSGGQPISIIFAMDQNHDGNPSNDQAVRLTPENGLCNPADMRFYKFPKRYREPVYSFREYRQGIRVQDIPALMAVRVTEELIALGLAEEPQDTHRYNVCARKHWEQLIYQETIRARAAAGQ